LLFRPTDLELKLSDKGKSDYMGVIKLQVTLVPKSQEDRDQVSIKNFLLLLVVLAQFITPMVGQLCMLSG
jgi:hypothetical protein